MNYKILNKYEVTDVKEFSIDIGDFNYLVIYGWHINGYFCAVPNWNWCCEMSNPEEVEYNKRNLFIDCGAKTDVATAIAEAIREVCSSEH